MCETTDLVPAATVASICEAYAQCKGDVLEAFRLLHQVETRLKTIFEYPHFLPDSWYLNETSGPESVTKMLRDCWSFLYRKTRVWEVCSIQQRRELEEELQRDKLPELTELNVFAFLEKLQASLPDMFEQSLKEVFDWLRPRDRWEPKYKTNNKYHVGKKVILGYCMERPWGRRFCVQYGKEQHLHALDNVFHLLDGRGIARYPNDLVTTLRTCGDQGLQECETEYFACKWFGNGNLHITFKRMDLVQEINKRAGASGLADYQPHDAEIVPVSDFGTGGNDDDDEESHSEAGAGRDAGAGPDDPAGPGRSGPPADSALPVAQNFRPGAAGGIESPVDALP
jgi:hypothetical protein